SKFARIVSSMCWNAICCAGRSSRTPRMVRGWTDIRRRLYTASMFDCRHQPLRLPAELVAQLAAAYGEPHRAYHNATHIAEVLGWFDRVRYDLGWLEPAEVYTAIVFHDAIYQPGAKDNEARSAKWARTAQLASDAKLNEMIVDRDRVAE